MTAGEVRPLRRALPALDRGRDTPGSRRLTGVLVAVGLSVLVAALTSAGVDPFSAVVLGLPALALVGEFVVAVAGGGRARPAPDGE